MMRRRRFMALLGGAAAWPLGARAQQSTMQVIGYLSSRSPEDTTHLLAGFRQGLADGGFIEHQNVTIEYRWALGQYDQLPALVTELTRLPVVAVVSTGGEPAALAAKAATSTIPIVFGTGTDPVKAGLVASYNRPGGNATGINFQTADMEAKRLGLLHELMPQAKNIVFLYNPKSQRPRANYTMCERPRVPSGWKLMRFTPAQMRKSTPPLGRWFSNKPRR
jgi:putative tryptophan/tyrosine transport system substrate-binding protein